MWNQKPSFRFEIDNFSEKETVVASKNFVSGGCEWYISVYPKGDRICNDHLCLFLHVANHKSLRTGWKRTANFYFVVLNQSEQELARSSIAQAPLFCDETPSGGFRKTMPLSKFQELGFLAKDRLIIEVYIKDVEGEDLSDKINGFQVSPSKVTLVRKIFTEHPDIVKDFKPNSQEVKTAYMNVLLKLIKKLEKPPKSLSYMTLTKAGIELSELMEVGFKLDWLKLKLEEVSFEKNKLDVDSSRVQTLEERVKNLELMESGYKLECLKTKFDELSSERKKADADSQKLEKRVKNLELMELDYKLECLKTKLDCLYSERKKADFDESHVQKLDKRVKNLELMESGYKLECLKTKLDELYSERKKADYSNGSYVQKVEERVKNLELMELGSKLDSLKTNFDSLKTELEEVSLERKKSDDANASVAQHVNECIYDLEMKTEELKDVSLERKRTGDADRYRVQQLEKRVKDLELMNLGFKLNTKLEEVSLERKKSEDADRSRIQQLEETVKDLKMMVSSLTVELDKKEDKSYDDEFFLVEDV